MGQESGRRSRRIINGAEYVFFRGELRLVDTPLDGEPVTIKRPNFGLHETVEKRKGKVWDHVRE